MSNPYICFHHNLPERDLLHNPDDKWINQHITKYPVQPRYQQDTNHRRNNRTSHLSFSHEINLQNSLGIYCLLSLASRKQYPHKPLSESVSTCVSQELHLQGYSFSFSFLRVHQSLKLAVHFSLTDLKILKVDLSHKAVCLPFAFSSRMANAYVCITTHTTIHTIVYSFLNGKSNANNEAVLQLNNERNYTSFA